MKMLELLDRFERLQLGCLRQNIQAKYEATLQQFMAEIEQLRQVLTYIQFLCGYMHLSHLYTYIHTYEVSWTWSAQCKCVQPATLVACTYVCTVCTYFYCTVPCSPCRYYSALSLHTYIRMCCEPETCEQFVSCSLIVSITVVLLSLLQTYQANYQNPPLDRNMPPIAGAIMWERQLMIHMENTIGPLRNKPNVIATPTGKQMTKRFNAMAKILVEYELVHHRGWVEMVEVARGSLNATVLVRHNGQLMVNLDPLLFEMEREVQCMKALGLGIPEKAQAVDITNMKATYHRLKDLVRAYSELCTIKHEVFAPLFRYQLRKVDRAISPGLVHVTWASFNVDLFIVSVTKSMGDMWKFIKQVSETVDTC